jgi:hypothetical protein
MASEDATINKLRNNTINIEQTQGDPTEDPQTELEKTVIQLAQKGTSDEKVNFLLLQALDGERSEQRNDDISRDHGIRLMARQKKQTYGRICFVFISLCLIYALQLVVLYNLGRFSKTVSTDTMTEWIERKQWKNKFITNYTVDDLPDQVRAVFGRSSVDYAFLDELGFCMTASGVFEVVFNVGSGLFLIYLFIFSDVVCFFSPPSKQNKKN